MELLDALYKRKSRRAFLPKPVDRNLIVELISAARAAPVSCNLQLSQYIVIDDPAVLADLSKRANYKFGMSPCMILVVQDPRFTVERQSGAVAAGAMMQNMLLRATELGLSACPMAGFRGDRVIRDVLKVPAHLDLLLLISIGYSDPAEPVGPISKVELRDTYRFNGYGDLMTLNGSPRLSDHTMADIVEYRTRIAPVYAYRYRLHTFKVSYYEAALTVLNELDPIRNAQTILDLVSYEGLFLKMLAESFKGRASVIGSDHVPFNREYFSKDIGVPIVPISRENVIDWGRSSVDAMTLVFHAEFTPELHALLASAAGILKPGGHVFVAVIRDSWYRRAMERIRHVFDSYIRRNKINIYEGNPFYRVGPRGFVSAGALDGLMRQAGLSKVREGVAARYRAQGRLIAYYVYRKSH